MNKVVKCVLVLLPLLVVCSLKANEQVNCLNIAEKYSAAELIERGQYRFTNKLNEEYLPAFSYDIELGYKQYIRYASELIAKKNPRANMPCPIITTTYQQLALQNNWLETPTVNQLLAPFELKHANSDKAVLLMHGLTDTPFSYHDLAQFFYQQGFTVRTLLLPGHGTAPSDLLDVDFEKWQQAANYAIERTLGDFEQVYLGGFSTGGALIFDYLMQHKQVDKKIKGLFMWSPASKAKSNLAWLAQYVDAIPFIDWIDLDADIDFAKYESFPYNAAAQVHELMSRIVEDQAMENRIMHNIPLFIVASQHDQTIETKQTLALIQQWQKSTENESSKKNILLYYGDKARVPATLANTLQVIIPKCSPGELCEDIYDVAHTATTNSPKNPHYGASGEYRNCGHYLADLLLYLQCKQSSQVIKGEITKENLQRENLIQRLTYNPYYTHMLTSMEQFLATTH